MMGALVRFWLSELQVALHEEMADAMGRQLVGILEGSGIEPREKGGDAMPGLQLTLRKQVVSTRGRQHGGTLEGTEIEPRGGGASRNLAGGRDTKYGMAWRQGAGTWALRTNHRGTRSKACTVTDGSGEGQQDRWEVTRGAKTAVGRHAVTALADAGWVTNAQPVTADAIGAEPRILDKRDDKEWPVGA